VRRNPSEEFPLLGLNPDQVEGILQRLQRWPVRLILGLSAALRRPLLKIYVLGEGARILGVAMVSFGPEVAQIGGLTVDASIRRRGFAQVLMNACERTGRHYRRSHLVLDVLSSNTPAIRLYEKLGYRTIRQVRWMVRDPTTPTGGWTTDPRDRLRPFRRADAPKLVEIASAAMPASVRALVRPRARDLRGASLSRRAGRVEAASWVLERQGEIIGYVKVVVSPAVEAAQFDPLFLTVPPAPEACRSLVGAALAWCAERQVPRAILALPDHLDELRPALEQVGFTENFRLQTMALNLSAS